MNGQRKVYGAILTLTFAAIILDLAFVWYTLQKIITLLLHNKDSDQMELFLSGVQDFSLGTVTAIISWTTVLLADIILACFLLHRSGSGSYNQSLCTYRSGGASLFGHRVRR